MNKCCFYGSLRRPMYNYERFVKLLGSDQMKYIKTTKIPGFRLYNVNNDYPAAIEGNIDDTIVVDLFELSDGAFMDIEYMEARAGYHEKIINIDDVMYSIFLFTYHQIKHDNFISSGDWVIYINNKKFLETIK